MSSDYETRAVSTSLEFGKKGPKVQANGQIFEHRDSSGALTRAKGANGVAADDFATVGQIGGASSPFGMLNPLVPPASPNAADVDTWTNLPTNWSAWSPSAGVAPSSSLDNGTLVLDFPARAPVQHVACGIIRPIPTANQWSATCRLSLITQRTGPNAFTGLGFGVGRDLDSAPTTGWLQTCDMYQVDSNSLNFGPRAIYRANYAAGVSAASGSPGEFLAPTSMWFRVRKVNASDVVSYAFEFSYDGLVWRPLHLGSDYDMVAGQAPTHLVIYGRVNLLASSNTPAYRVLVGPLRVNESADAATISEIIPAGI